MKERPILFNSPMVRAILEGRKGQTRRVVKPQPACDGIISDGPIHGPEMYEPVAYDRHGEMIPGAEIFGIYDDSGEWGVKCPYGRLGDRLWVRETWSAHFMYNDVKPSEIYHEDGDSLWCHATSDESPVRGSCHGDQRGKWRPSIFMPRWASRILLEITGIRVERLNDISRADAENEGLSMWPHKGDYAWGYDGGHEAGHGSPTGAFMALWGSINGADSWKANPWVWVVKFKRI